MHFCSESKLSAFRSTKMEWSAMSHICRYRWSHCHAFPTMRGHSFWNSQTNSSVRLLLSEIGHSKDKCILWSFWFTLFIFICSLAPTVSQTLLTLMSKSSTSCQRWGNIESAPHYHPQQPKEITYLFIYSLTYLFIHSLYIPAGHHSPPPPTILLPFPHLFSYE